MGHPSSTPRPETIRTTSKHLARKPRSRIADLMIAAIAITEDLPLYTTNPSDFTGLEDLLTVVPVTRPHPTE
jgi:predicted nucleic acid-binding protein